MDINIDEEVLNYLREKDVKDIKWYLEDTKGSKWCPVIFDVQVDLLTGDKKQKCGEQIV